jgi:DMSO reductase anchor subunit
VAAFLAALGAGLTVYCTGQIYATLKPIGRWFQPLTTPCYLALALSSGLVIAVFVLRMTAGAPFGLSLVAMLSCAVAWGLKWRWWLSGDRAAPRATAASATGLRRFGKVRLLEPPHTGPSYLTQEMGFVIARKHSLKLRRLALLGGLGLTPALLAVGAIAGGVTSLVTDGGASLSTLAATLIERWLFFAEAQHTVSLYYGAETA